MKCATQACFLKMAVSCIPDSWKTNQNKELIWGSYERIGEKNTCFAREIKREWVSKNEREGEIEKKT